jgi:hypothetical protein
MRRGIGEGAGAPPRGRGRGAARTRREKGREGERRGERKLTLGSDDRRQPPTRSHLGKRRWKRGRGSCCAGKENEVERRGGAHGGGGGARGQVGSGRTAGRAENPLHARPQIGIKLRIENRNEMDARLDTTPDK